MNLAYHTYPPPGERQVNLPPVVMLHGMLDSRKTWKYIAPNIAKNTGRLVYVVDARNHGESPWSDAMGWNILASDVEAFLISHGIPKAIVIGHSMGGVTSFTFALKRPDMVDKLIVEDIATRTIRVKDGRVIAQIIMFLRESLNAIPEGADEMAAKRSIAEFIKALLPEDQTPSVPTFDMDMVPLKKVGNSYAWQANLDVIEDFLVTDKLYHDVSKAGVFNGDTMFLYGTKSFFRVDRDTLIEKLFPRAIKVGFEGANHLIHHEFPEKFLQVVCDFINNGPKPLSKI